MKNLHPLRLVRSERLKRELRAGGAAKGVDDELASLAHLLSATEIPALSREAKLAIAEDIGFKHHPYRRPLRLVLEGTVATVFIVVLILAQFTKPGSALYGVKRGTEKVRQIIVQIPQSIESEPEPEHEPGHNQGGSSSHDDSTGSGGSLPDDNSHGGDVNSGDISPNSGSVNSGKSGSDDLNKISTPESHGGNSGPGHSGED